MNIKTNLNWIFWIKAVFLNIKCNDALYVKIIIYSKSLSIYQVQQYFINYFTVFSENQLTTTCISGNVSPNPLRGKIKYKQWEFIIRLTPIIGL